MNNKKCLKWLEDNKVVLEESFCTALKNLAIEYKNKNSIKYLKDAYKILGIKKEYLYYWERHEGSTQQKKYKRQIINSIGEVLKLSDDEKEKLTNKAGISLNVDKNFNREFKKFILEKVKGKKRIDIKSNISERMFYYFLKNRIPSKNSLLAICIILDMNLEEIEEILLKAGYVLSNSITLDSMVKKC